MRLTCSVSLVAVVALGLAAAPGRAADNYAIDPAHSSVTFKVQHVGISWVHGRFNNLAGTFTIDKDDPGKSAFEATIKTDSIDTAQPARDKHLKSPDFFNAQQFPEITFKTTSVKAVEGGYELTGDLTLHGVTKAVVFTLQGGKTAEFPKGTQRIGFTAAVTLKRSDFGMDKFIPAVSDEVPVEISFEGVKK
jgi:polyisoprenoid-binding protein YceI